MVNPFLILKLFICQDPASIVAEEGAMVIHHVFLSVLQRQQIMGTIQEKGAVLMNDKKWAISVRTPFPHELPPDL